MENRLESLPSDESANREDKEGINGICENSFQLSNANRLSHARPNPIGAAVDKYGQTKANLSGIKFGRYHPWNRP